MRNPKAFFKSVRNLRFNFDMFHGNGLIDKAIELLDDDNKEDFRNFVNTNTSYNQCNLFICRSKDKIKNIMIPSLHGLKSVKRFLDLI